LANLGQGENEIWSFWAENEILTVRAEHLGQEMRPRVLRAEKVRAEK
jgi:hypothetical protein